MSMLFNRLPDMPHGMDAALVLAIGWFAAIVTRLVVVRLLQLLRFNRLCNRIGVDDFLRKGGVTFPPAELAGRGLSALILISAFLEAARILDIGALQELRRRAGAAVPSMISAGLVLAVGLMVVSFIAGFLRTVGRNAGNPYAAIWSRIARWTGTLLVLALALEQAVIQSVILPGVIHIVIAAFALGLALAFGLGCKDLARQVMEKWIADLKERHRNVSKPDMEG